MARKIYRVDPELTPQLRRVLKRGFYEFRFYRNADGEQLCETNASSNVFHKVVLRARCEKADEETGLFHITKAEARDHMYVRALLWGREDPGAAVIIDGCPEDEPLG